jgi:crossover junction endodeoxyribonuclease RuvC
MDCIYIGVDPGASGGIVGINERGGPVGLWSLQKMTLQEIHAAFSALKAFEVPLYAMIEKVHSMPKQGVASSFKFGMSYGALLSALCAPPAIKHELVPPHIWQKALGSLSRGNKNVTKQRAQSLFPTITMTHALADAFLIAEYGRRFGPWKIEDRQDAEREEELRSA